MGGGHLPPKTLNNENATSCSQNCTKAVGQEGGRSRLKEMGWSRLQSPLCNSPAHPNPVHPLLSQISRSCFFPLGEFLQRLDPCIDVISTPLSLIVPPVWEFSVQDLNGSKACLGVGDTSCRLLPRCDTIQKLWRNHLHFPECAWSPTTLPSPTMRHHLATHSDSRCSWSREGTAASLLHPAIGFYSDTVRGPAADLDFMSLCMPGPAGRLIFI